MAGVLAVAVALGAGYWLGARGRSHEGSAAAAQAGAPSAKKERKILYYRNPMGLPDTSPVPKKDPMGMDYIPVYEGEEEPAAGTANQIRISVEKVQKLGVRTEQAAVRRLDRVVRAAGRIEVDERRVYAVAPKFEGWVERLFVNVTGQPVAKGQPLFEVYSPELVSAQREYALAAQGRQSLKDAPPDARAAMKQLADSSLARLRNWDISQEQIDALARTGNAKRTMTFRSPVSGVVLEKKALQGMRFMPGESLYQIADISAVWVLADVFEQDIAHVKTGSRARMTIAAYPGQVFEGKVTYIYPTLNPETRTVQVRLEMANPRQLLKPAMFAQVEVPVAGHDNVVTVPLSAVIDSGVRQIVLVQVGEGRFEPREVKLGQRGDNYVQVLEGVAEGEPVVVAANFLIDAESNLKAAIGGLGHGGHGGSAPGQKAEDVSAKGVAVGHRAEGTIDAIDAQAGSATVSHGPIPTLKWPAMTMDFRLANPALAANIKSGSAVSIEIVERKPGEWVITKIEPRTAAEARPSGQAAPGGHSGH